MKRSWGMALALSSSLLWCPAQQVYRFDTNTSVVQVHLDTAGVLGFMGHAHLIQTSIKQGNFVYDPRDLSKSSVELVVDAGALRVMDPKRSAAEREEIQTTMQSDQVLGIEKHPQIVFKSFKIEPLGHNRLQVAGNLTIRGNTRPIVLQVALEQKGAQLEATGESHFTQSTFGIRPVSGGLGTVRVKDRMSISFSVFARLKADDRSSSSKGN